MEYTRTASSPGKGVTHVLHWVPLYTDSRDGDAWALQTLREYEEAARPGPQRNSSPRDADPGKLAEWASETLGVPVTVEPGSAVILLAGPRGQAGNRGGKEPLYYIRAEPAPDTAPGTPGGWLRIRRGSLRISSSGPDAENA